MLHVPVCGLALPSSSLGIIQLFLSVGLGFGMDSIIVRAWMLLVLDALLAWALCAPVAMRLIHVYGSTPTTLRNQASQQAKERKRERERQRQT